MKVQNLVVKEEYQKDGNTVTNWNQIGIIFTKEDGKQFIKLNMFPNLMVYVMDKKDKTTQKPVKSVDLDNEAGF